MSIPKVSTRQLKASRALLGWSQTDLASHSGVSQPTIKRLESSEGEIGGKAGTVSKIIAALAEGGVEFLDGEYQGSGGPGVRLRDRI